MAIGEIVLRLLNARPGFQPVPDDLPGLWQPDSTLRFVYAANYQGIMERPYYRIDFRTNGLGMRDREIAELPQGFSRILVVGNSFTVGWGVQRTDAWPAQAEGILRRRDVSTTLLNGAVSGYGMDQIRRRAVGLLDTIRPDAVLVGAFDGGWGRLDDPYILLGMGVAPRSLETRMVSVPGGFLNLRTYRPWMQSLEIRLMKWWYGAAYTYRALYGAWEAMHPPPEASQRAGREPADTVPTNLARELTALGEVLAARATPWALLLIDGQDADGTFPPVQIARHRALLAFALRHHVRVIDPLPTLQQTASGRPIYRLPDGHWSRAAQRIAGRVVADSLQAWGASFLARH